MNLNEAFQFQIENTRLLVEEDLVENTEDFVVWNRVAFRPDGNFYSSGKEMQVGDLFLIGYVVKNTQAPKPILFEVSEIDMYNDLLNVIRVVDNIPVMCYKNQSDDQYRVIE